ncbi:MAG TPA: glycosyltransferase [Bryobacteraceae bacterium]|nr:glycosyltransferase [Bryobacteraceae bacterium]
MLSYWLARIAAHLRGIASAASHHSPGPDPGPPAPGLAPGISVVIPSRNGRALLNAQLSGILRESPDEVIVVDNGSDDGTFSWLAADYPSVIVETSPEPLGFARSINRGLRRVRHARVCLLNNDMLIEPGFFTALDAAFTSTPDLFCATAQIRFPEGVRREETGKAVMRQQGRHDFPIRCDDPLPGEDGTWVLYGSGGCSLYDTAKLAALGGVDEVYDPAYVEDLDLGYRAWLRGWPSVYVAGAVVEHRHRATTSRYYTEEQLSELLEINYLKFLARAIESPQLFRRLWKVNLDRLRATQRHSALRAAAGIAFRWDRRLRLSRTGQRPVPPSEDLLLALTDGSVACFPGRGEAEPVVIAADRLEPPPAALLERHHQVVVVRGAKKSPAFRAAESMLRQQALGL